MALTSSHYLIIGSIIVIIIIVSILLLRRKDTTSSTSSTTIVAEGGTGIPLQGDKNVKISPEIFNYNPSTNVLTASTFKGNLEGTAKSVAVQENPQTFQQQRMLQQESIGQSNKNNIYHSINDMKPKSAPLVGQTAPIPATSTQKKFLTMVDGTGSQDLRSSAEVWYDTVNKYLNADAINAYNIKNGVANQIPVQAGPNNTTFIPAPIGSNQYLRWTGSTYEFGNVIVPPAGSNNQLQFNNNGVFGASPNLTFDQTTGNLSASGQLRAGSGLTVTGPATFSSSIAASTGTFTGSLAASGLLSGAAGLTITGPATFSSSIAATSGNFSSNLAAGSATFGGNLAALSGRITNNLQVGTLTSGLITGSAGLDVTGAGTFSGNLAALSGRITNNLQVGTLTSGLITGSAGLDVTGAGTFSGNLAASSGRITNNLQVGTLTSGSATFSGNLALGSAMIPSSGGTLTFTSNEARFSGKVISASGFEGPASQVTITPIP
jgi:hypothetical protein